MSKIQKELVTATGVKVRDDRQAFIVALLEKIADLSDKEWEELSKPAQNWYNEAADARNAKKSTLPDFPDYEPEEEEAPRRRASKDEEEEAPRRRRSADAEEEAPKKREPKKGDKVKVTSKRGKEYEGEYVGLDGDEIVLKDGKEEFGVVAAGATIEILGGDEEEAPRRRRKAAEEDEEPKGYEPKIGDEVKLVTQRGKEYEGTITELDDKGLVLKVGKEEFEFEMDRVGSMEPKGGKKATKDEEETPRRRASKDEDAKEETPAKRTRSTNEGGVSVGQRITELICDDLEATEADIGKALKKEGLDFKENTLKLNFTAVHKVLDVLKSKKMLKA